MAMADPLQDKKPANLTGYDASLKVTEEAPRTAPTMAESSENAARVSTDTIKRDAETVQQAWQAASDLATKLAERSADQFAHAFGLSGKEAQQAAQQ
jgi:hypothetical protein